jgi:hypothetical protein
VSKRISITFEEAVRHARETKEEDVQEQGEGELVTAGEPVLSVSSA